MKDALPVLRCGVATYHVKRAAELLKEERAKGRPTDVERALKTVRRILESAFERLEERRAKKK